MAEDLPPISTAVDAEQAAAQLETSARSGHQVPRGGEDVAQRVERVRAVPRVRHRRPQHRLHDQRARASERLHVSGLRCSDLTHCDGWWSTGQTFCAAAKPALLLSNCVRSEGFSEPSGVRATGHATGLQILIDYALAFNTAAKGVSERLYVDLVAGQPENLDCNTGEGLNVLTLKGGGSATVNLLGRGSSGRSSLVAEQRVRKGARGRRGARHLDC